MRGVSSSIGKMDIHNSISQPSNIAVRPIDISVTSGETPLDRLDRSLPLLPTRLATLFSKSRTPYHPVVSLFLGFLDTDEVGLEVPGCDGKLVPYYVWHLMTTPIGWWQWRGQRRRWWGLWASGRRGTQRRDRVITRLRWEVTVRGGDDTWWHGGLSWGAGLWGFSWGARAELVFLTYKQSAQEEKLQMNRRTDANWKLIDSIDIDYTTIPCR